MSRLRIAFLWALLASALSAAPEAPGLRVATAGHSFHVWMAPIVDELAKGAGIEGHRTVASSFIGGSATSQHWNLPEGRNKVKAVLTDGGADVLTLSPTLVPDDAILKFTQHGLAKNPGLKVTVQQSWIPYDDLSFWIMRKRPASVERDSKTPEQLRAAHADYFKLIDAEVRSVNAKLGKEIVKIVPAGSAVLALRERVLKGEVPGVAKQSQLFSDPLGHPTEPIKALNSYCHFAVIYGRSPVGLPVPKGLQRAPEAPRLNSLLQQIAWDAVLAHPLAGVPRQK
ncbi:MAG: hypothetical protein FJ410_02660 [Verrucomicrobia bacterium]|nr:hypothetical protein [Verrucomicrobiota bacterium]